MEPELDQRQLRDAGNDNRNAAAPRDEKEKQLFPADETATRDQARVADTDDCDASKNIQIGYFPRNRPDAGIQGHDAELAVRDAAASDDLLIDPARYNLTIGQSVEKFVELGRKPLGERRLQEYCAIGDIDAYKLQTQRKGRPVTEWLVHEPSLLAFIEKREKVSAAQPVSHDAEQDQKVDPIAPEDEVEQLETEKRSLAELLIDNAGLVAELKGKDELIGELQKDKVFDREMMRKAIEGQSNVTVIAERMLETLETIAIGGKLTRLPKSPSPQERTGEEPTVDNDV